MRSVAKSLPSLGVGAKSLPIWQGKNLIWVLIVGLALGLVGFIQAEESDKPTKEDVSEERIAELIKQLGDDDWQKREHAQKKLEEIGESAKPFLKKVQESPDAEIRQRVEVILSTIAVKKRVKFSEGMLKEFPNIYHDLARFDAQDKFAILDQITTCEDNDTNRYEDKVTNDDMAELIHEVLLDDKRLTSGDKLAILIVCQGNRTYKDRGHGSIYRFGWHTPIPKVVPDIIKLLRDEALVVRICTVDVLTNLKAKEAIPEIMRLLKDENEQVRGVATRALGKLGAKEAIPEINRFLKDEERSSVTSFAVRALGDLGVKEAVPDIIKLLKDKEGMVQKAAAYALGELGPKEAIPEIMDLLKHKAWDIRSAGIYALGKLEAKETIPEIIKLLKDEHGFVRMVTGIVLVELGAKDKVSKEVIDDIKFLLAHPDYKQRAEAALKELGIEEK